MSSGGAAVDVGEEGEVLGEGRLVGAGRWEWENKCIVFFRFLSLPSTQCEPETTARLRVVLETARPGKVLNCMYVFIDLLDLECLSMLFHVSVAFSFSSFASLATVS